MSDEAEQVKQMASGFIKQQFAPLLVSFAIFLYFLSITMAIYNIFSNDVSTAIQQSNHLIEMVGISLVFLIISFYNQKAIRADGLRLGVWSAWLIFIAYLNFVYVVNRYQKPTLAINPVSPEKREPFNCTWLTSFNMSPSRNSPPGTYRPIMAVVNQDETELPFATCMSDSSIPKTTFPGLWIHPFKNHVYLSILIELTLTQY